MLLYTASMGVGVEYTLEHVDKRYLLVNYNLVGADGYLQLLGRVRSPKSKTVEMFISKSSRKQSERLPTTRDAVKRQIDAGAKHAQDHPPIIKALGGGSTYYQYHTKEPFIE